MRRIVLFVLAILFVLVSNGLTADMKIIRLERPDIPGFVGYATDKIVVKFHSDFGPDE